jgi:hypothetical protein
MEFVVDKICAALLNGQAMLDMNDVKAELRSRQEESKDGIGEKDGTEKHCAEHERAAQAGRNYGKVTVYRKADKSQH